jgi:hypothetical protein
MTDTPASIDIHEEGPREGVQIAPGPIAGASKVRLVEAIERTRSGSLNTFRRTFA